MFAALLAVIAFAAADVDALKQRATLEYWSGDFRSAKRDFEAVLRARPNDAEARQAVDDITAASRPVIVNENRVVTDDQPLRRNSTAISYTQFSDPLTKWTATAGTYALHARTRTTSPFASLGVDTKFARLHATAALRVLRFPDGHDEPLGGFTIAREWRGTSIGFELDRHELLYTASSLRTHPSETTAALGWKRESGASSSAATLRAIRYFDRNHGRALDAYHLARITPVISIGASASYRDTDESRFNGANYDPYWTPLAQLEARGVVAAKLRAHRVTVDLHADGGVARDRERSFRPWRAFADVSIPLRGTFNATAGVERQSTVFYRANSFHFGFSGRL